LAWHFPAIGGDRQQQRSPLEICSGEGKIILCRKIKIKQRARIAANPVDLSRYRRGRVKSSSQRIVIRRGMTFLTGSFRWAR
jgi:hypothetical protein